MRPPKPKANPLLPSYVDNIRALHAKLAQLYEPEDALVWLFSIQESLGGRMPAQLILQGRVEDINRLLDQILEGAYI